MLDEPQGIPETHNLTLAGWNAAPTAAEIIARAAPLLGVRPALQGRFKRMKKWQRRRACRPWLSKRRCPMRLEVCYPKTCNAMRPMPMWKSPA